MTTSKPPHTIQGGAGTAWLATAGVGCVFAAGMASMIKWNAGGHAPHAVTLGFWIAVAGFAVVCGVYALTVASRRRPAAVGVESLTLAERNRLAADRLDDAVDDAEEPVAL